MLRTISILGLVFIGIYSCRKNNQTNIPYVPVNESLVLAEPSNFPLTSVGGWVYLQSGYRGIIVYRKAFNGDSEDFIAFDRACPRHFDQDCGRLKVETNDLYLACTCDCKRWLLINGFPEQDDAGFLQQYQTTFGSGILLIRNF